MFETKLVLICKNILYNCSHELCGHFGLYTVKPLNDIWK